MPKLDALDIVRSGARSPGDFKYLFCRNIEKFGSGIDEALDQPGTGNPVYFGPLPCYPTAGRHGPDAACRQPLLDPTGDTALQIEGFDAGGAKRAGNVLANVITFAAVHHDRLVEGHV